MTPGERAMQLAQLSALFAQSREEIAASEALIQNADAVLAAEYQKALDKNKTGPMEQILPTAAGIIAAPLTGGMSIPAAAAVTGGVVAASHAGGQLIDKGRVDMGRALTSGAISGATTGLTRGFLDKGLDWLGNKAEALKGARVAEGEKLAGVEAGFETETGLGAATKVKEMTPKAGLKERIYSGLSSDTGRAAMVGAINNIATQYLRPGAPDVPIPRGLRPQTQLSIQQQRMEQQQTEDQAAYQQEMLGLQKMELEQHAELAGKGLTAEQSQAELNRKHALAMQKTEITAEKEEAERNRQFQLEQDRVKGWWAEKGAQDRIASNERIAQIRSSGGGSGGGKSGGETAAKPKQVKTIHHASETIAALMGAEYFDINEEDGFVNFFMPDNIVLQKPLSEVQTYFDTQIAEPMVREEGEAGAPSENPLDQIPQSEEDRIAIAEYDKVLNADGTPEAAAISADRAAANYRAGRQALDESEAKAAARALAKTSYDIDAGEPALKEAYYTEAASADLEATYPKEVGTSEGGPPQVRDEHGKYIIETARSVARREGLGFFARHRLNPNTVVWEYNPVTESLKPVPQERLDKETIDELGRAGVRDRVYGSLLTTGTKGGGQDKDNRTELVIRGTDRWNELFRKTQKSSASHQPEVRMF